MVDSQDGASTRLQGLEQEVLSLRVQLQDLLARAPSEVLPRPGIDGEPVDDRHRNVEVRQFSSAVERDLMQLQMHNSWPYQAPFSTLVTVIGHHYKPGSWQKIVDMTKWTIDRGIKVGFSEIQDRCFDPYDALGTMRNEAVLKAEIEGWEYLCMLDADVMPEPDALYCLLGFERNKEGIYQYQPANARPVVAPYVVEEGTGRRLHGPIWEPEQGLKPVKWCVLSMLLFRTSVFRSFMGSFWEDAIGADEGFHFQKLYAYTGILPFLHTSIQVIAQGRPHYPLASLRFSRKDYDRYWEDSQRGRLAPPDRRPIKEGVPVNPQGEYFPFIKSDVSPVKPAEDAVAPVTLPEVVTNAIDGKESKVDTPA